MTIDHAPTPWASEHVAKIATQPGRRTGLITAAQVAAIAPGLDVWDLWPIQEHDGRVAHFPEGELWLALSAPAIGDPVLRHGKARLRVLSHCDGAWRDLGPAFADGSTPGSREWSGSAIVDAGHTVVTLFFTAAGRRGEPKETFEQRLFQGQAPVLAGPAGIRLGAFSPPSQSFVVDDRLYHPANQSEGAPGQIKAFRDPAFFRDSTDGTAYLLFAASLPLPCSPFNGAVGLAKAADDDLKNWTILPPLIHAEGLNNELERPHLVYRRGLYYLFWSTQAEVFAPNGPVGPTGLYGMVSEKLFGPYEPLNGSGLVLANPDAAPFQAYSWLVASDLTVSSFINYYGVSGPQPPRGDAARAVFGGAPAPMETIVLDGSRTW